MHAQRAMATAWTAPCALHTQPALCLIQNLLELGSSPFLSSLGQLESEQRVCDPQFSHPLCDPAHCSITQNPSTLWAMQTSPCQGPGDYFS